MKSFEYVWAFIDSIPGSFTRLSAEKLYDICSAELPANASIAEIGVDQGRSLSVMLCARQDTPTSFLLVDSWESVLIDNKAKVEKLLSNFPNAKYIICHGKSVDVGRTYFAQWLDLIHIDAYHFDNIEDGGPSRDCEVWLEKLKPGGIACFHDYNSCFPDVNIAVDKYCAGWEDLGVWDGLAIRRKP